MKQSLKESTGAIVYHQKRADAYTKHNKLLLIVLITALLVLPVLINGASAQTQTNYYVIVNPVFPGIPQYINIERNATFQFEAKWAFGPNQGQFIKNATALIYVTNQKGAVVDMLSENTTSGVFSFNYSTVNPSILTFTPTKLVTADGKEWTNETLVDPSENAYGFTSDFTEAYFDTFHVSMVNYDTSSVGRVAATINVTYLMLPEDGLMIGSILHFSKIGEGLNVTINGVEAQETAPGIYTASSSTWFSTAYVNVKVSGNNWATTVTCFGVIQSANQSLWMYGVAFASIAVSASFFIRFMASKRVKSGSLGGHPNFPFFGGVTLAAVSVISLYWGIVGLEGIVHTFNWLGLAVFGVFAFVFGIIGSLSLMRRKYLPLTITAAIIPMITNVIVIKASLDMYLLASPWLLLLGALVLSVLSGFFICNVDSAPQKQAPQRQTSPF